jgi:ubiquinone/menaquinone biosynthesis C-methylase UbiE
MVQFVPSESEIKAYWEKPVKRRCATDSVVQFFTGPKIKWFLSKISIPPKMNLLDIGCGNGYFTLPLSKHFDVKGIDQSEVMMDLNPHRNIIKGNISHLPFADETFDITFSANVIYYLENPEIGIDEMIRVSKKYVILIMPNLKNPIMLLFALIKRSERCTLKLIRKGILQIMNDKKVRLLCSCSHGFTTPTLTPSYLCKLFPLLNSFSKLGFFSIYIYEKE